MYKPDFIKYFKRKQRSRSSYIAKVIGGILFTLVISNAAFTVVSAHELEAYNNDTVAYRADFLHDVRRQHDRVLIAQ